MMQPLFAPKQIEFIQNSNAMFNIAHGSVRSGKTVCTLFRFMKAVHDCPGTSIWMIGHTLETIFDNVIQLLFNSEQLKVFAPFCTWYPGRKELVFGSKSIYCLGAKDERAMGPIQGKTFDLCYCDEMTLYPESIVQMIITRLSMPHSQLFASMNPVQPSNVIKEKLINKAIEGDKKYYQLHFSVEDNIFLTEQYKDTLKETLTGLFYRRNYLGEWCLAEGSIFDFFDKDIHVVRRPPRPAEFFIAGVDYGTSNPTACVLVGYNSGRANGEGAHLWVEKEYYWDRSKAGRAKTPGELVRDLQNFFEGYYPRTIYIDPSAAALREEMKRANMHTKDADNDVYNGIVTMCNLVNEGSLSICVGCHNLIREIEGYVWDPAASKKGDDAPLKQADHAIDALRYAVRSFCAGKMSLKMPRNEGDDFGRTLGYQRSRF
jgi:PBSX family phage terminase large subunit